MASMMSFQKLEGSENYSTWKFAMEMQLKREKLWTVTSAPGTTPDPEDIDRAMGTIGLAVQPHSIIQGKTTAKGMWDALKASYEDKGLMRRINLRRKLYGTKLSDCKGMNDYIDRMLSISQQLVSIGVTVDDEEIAMAMLQNLTSEFDFLVVALESGSVTLTTEVVRTKLLQFHERIPSEVSSAEGTALASNTKGKFKKYKFTGRCYKCQKIGHRSKDCKMNWNDDRKDSSKKERKNESALQSTSGSLNSQCWYVDSGASRHMSSRKEWFSQLRKCEPVTIQGIGNKVLTGREVGTVTIRLNLEGQVVITDIEDVLYVPELGTNLIAISVLEAKGFRIEFAKGSCIVRNRKDTIIASATRCQRLYTLDIMQDFALAAMNEIPTMELWHRRLGHLGHGNFLKLMGGMVNGITVENSEKTSCVSCITGKQHRTPFPKVATNRAEKPLALVHTDVCEPMEVASFSGARYFLTFIDDATRKTHVYFLKQKSEVAERIAEYKAEVENETGLKIKVIRSDNGGEYENQTLSSFLKKHGIKHQLTIPYTPEQNGVSERANRTIVERTRAILNDSGLEKRFWAEAVSTVVYLKNRAPTLAVQGMTPEEAWTKKKPNVEHLRVFGCRAYMHIPKEKRRKLDSKTLPCLLLGYCEESKGYRLWDIEGKRVVKARDVIFHETVSQVVEARIEKLEKLVTPQPKKDLISLDVIFQEAVPEKPEDPVEIMEEIQVERIETVEVNEAQHIVAPVEVNEAQPIVAVETIKTEVRISARPNKGAPPERYGEEVAHLALDEPHSIKDAKSSGEWTNWKEAIDQELAALDSNKTWTIVDRPLNRKTIKNKWIFTKKLNADGSLARHKARLVAKGYTQQYGIDYEESFSPVAKYSTLRLIIALAALKELTLHHLDFDSAYLNGDLEEEIFMEFPEHYIENGFPEGKVCLLKKSLYGLKQSGRCWYRKLDEALQSLGFSRSETDPCLYYKIGEELLFVVVYVDDLLIAGNTRKIKEVTISLSTQFKLKDLGEAHQILGLQIEQDHKKGTICIGQQRYVENMLQQFGMSDSKPVSTPIDANSKLDKSMCPSTPSEIEDMKNVPYQSAVGTLMYAAISTRPDIMHAVSKVSQLCVNPGKAHWIAVKRIFRYLKGTANMKIVFTGEGQLEGYCDADYGADFDDRRSYTGYVFLLGNATISWCSRKQPTVALSTTEAEYMALTEASKEAMWLKKILVELNFLKQEESVVLCCDNRGAIDLSGNAKHHGRSKHIAIKHHYVRGLVQDREIVPKYTVTDDNLADFLTKGLPSAKHCELIKPCGLICY